MKLQNQMKLTTLFLFFNILILHSQYCTPIFGDPSQLYISRVVLNTLDVSQTYVSTSNSYSNLTANSTTLTSGSTYTMTIYSTRVDPFRESGYGIWIDYNNDNDFDDANEKIGTIIKTNASSVNFSFTAPLGTSPGNKRMRINAGSYYEPGPCDNSGWSNGETEDYSITIIPLNPIAANDNLSVLTNSTAGVPNQVNVATNDSQGSSNGYDTDNYAISSPPTTAQGGTVTEISDGVFQYIPATDFIGTDSFTYSFCDTGGDCSTGTVFISVNLGACTPTSNSQGSHYITNVHLPGETVTINNASGNDGGYANYTNVVPADLVIGSTYPLTITNVGSNSGWAAYIDFNRNGNFTDSGEMVYATNGQEGTNPFVTRNITIPGTATAGHTIMRVGTRQWWSSNEPCGNTGGSPSPEEFEDYEVSITTQLNPKALNDNLSVLTNSTAGVPNQVNVATNDTQGTSDAYDGDNYSITSSPLTTAQGGTVTEISDGVFQYIPATNFIGTDSFNYSFCDTNNDCSTGTVFISVNLGACTPTSNSQGSHYITNVHLPGETVTINNASGNDGGYANYTNVAPADLYIGSTYPLTINNSGANSGWTAYIDFNRNGVFDSSEMVYNTHGEESSYPFLTRNIIIPGTATAGSTIMRIGTRRYWSSENPCGNTEGQPEEFEDYEVNITVDMTAPQDISVAGNSNSILNGSITPETSNLTSFGIQDVTSGLKSRTFTITNNGYLDLTLGSTPVSFQAGSDAEFSITSQPAANTIIPTGTSVTFTIAFDPGTTGTFDATIQISSNDPDENPFAFLIEAEGVQIYKDSDEDGITDNIDIDDDNDGIRDVVEQMGCTSNPLASVVETEFLLEDFGSGTSKIKIDGSTAGVTTTYCFEDGTTAMGVDECDTSPDLGDGKYTVHYSIADGLAPSAASASGTDLAYWADNAWTTTKDHTPGDTNGRMAIFNAATLPGVFYETQITGVLPNVPITYNFWAMNIDNPDANFSTGELPRNKPNITINFLSTDYFNSIIYL